MNMKLVSEDRRKRKVTQEVHLVEVMHQTFL